LRLNEEGGEGWGRGKRMGLEGVVRYILFKGGGIKDKFVHMLNELNTTP
jgi:hypothetical protein